jgi:peptidyl-prolyl cis-trans isomerase A (cyclophilin A)
MVAAEPGYDKLARSPTMATRNVKEAEEDFEHMRARILRWLAFACITIVGLHAGAQTNGIFADFTTSMGDFTCELDYTNSPKAVANFVGLATGARAWLDLVTGEARTSPFYNALTFHRVVMNFVNQAGSPNGQGTDGPGYSFVDQFSPALNFNSPWILAMANSGPDSNGSQFFVTVAPFTSGNNTYVIFGRVVSGTNVLTAINDVATDANSKPLTNVIIQQVAIRRVGTAAQAFDINAQGLPVVTNVPLRLKQSSKQISLTFSNRLFADNRWYSTTNLNSWVANSLGIEIVAPSSNSVQVAMDSSNQFFRFAQIQYASSTFAPKNVLGRTLTLSFSTQGTSTIVFNTTGGGTFAYAGNAGTVTSYTWSQDTYRGFLYPIQFSAILPEMTLQLNFTAAKAGTFSGSAYNPFPVSVSGTFTLAP